MKTKNHFYLNIKTSIIKLMLNTRNLKALLSFAAFALYTIAAPFTVMSQSGQKWATDGITASGTDFIGTKNWFPLIFKTNNTEKLRITSYGFVGVGTNNPFKMVDVNGSLNAKDTIFTSYIFIKAGAGLNKVLVSDANGMAHWQSGVVGATGFTGATGEQGIQGVTGATGATGTFNGSPIDSLRVNGFIKADSMRVIGILHIGDSSIVLNPNYNSITWSGQSLPPHTTIKGFAIGNSYPLINLDFPVGYADNSISIGSGPTFSWGIGSIAIGTNIVNGSNSQNSISIGSGFINKNNWGAPLLNDIPVV